MLKQIACAAFLTAMTLSPAYADDSKEWCNDAHMQKMQTMVDAMTDASKKEAAQMHLDGSNAAMKKSDMTGCVDHMKEAHAAMGL
jgi:hypothetical protein